MCDRPERQTTPGRIPGCLGEVTLRSFISRLLQTKDGPTKRPRLGNLPIKAQTQDTEGLVLDRVSSSSSPTQPRLVTGRHRSTPTTTS